MEIIDKPTTMWRSTAALLLCKPHFDKECIYAHALVQVVQQFHLLPLLISGHEYNLKTDGLVELHCPKHFYSLIEQFLDIAE